MILLVFSGFAPILGNMSAVMQKLNKNISHRVADKTCPVPACSSAITSGGCQFKLCPLKRVKKNINGT